MATRACVKIEGIEFAKVYKHWDGYPEAMMGWLQAFNEKFSSERGVDPSYKFAQLLRSSTKTEFKLDANEFTGYGVIPFDSSCGEEWEYTLLTDGKIEVKEV